MRHDTQRFRWWLFGFTALVGLGGAAALRPAWAQDAPPLPQAGDPPARVGRLAQLSGTVGFRAAASDDFSPAALNYPVTTGNQVQVARPGHAELDVDADRFALPGGSEMQVTRLDDSTMAATLDSGEVCFVLAPVPPGQSYSVQTPRGLVQVAAGGRYAVVAGDTAHPTLVTVAEGAATVTAGSATLAVAAGQAASLTGRTADQAQGTVGPAAADQCLTDLTAPPAAQVVGPPPPPAVLQMTGGTALAGYGAWQPEPEYGSVWFPRVAADWVPYRHGHWAFVVPWGWTWVDDAPWGFAPFHYGRWAEFHGRWGWTPGERRGVPVYAPALVTFFGLGVAGASVGWVPLAPREPYYPWYHASGTYVREINVRHVTDTTVIERNYTSNTYNNIVVNHYANAAGATSVPAGALARSQPVAPLIQRVTPQQLAAARPVVGRQAEPGVAGPAAAAAFRLPVPERPAPAAHRASVAPQEVIPPQQRQALPTVHEGTRPPPAEAVTPHEVRPPATAAMPHEVRPPVAGATPREVRPPVAATTPHEVRPPVAAATPREVRPPVAGAMPHEVRPPVAGATPHEVRPPVAGVTPHEVRPPVAAAAPREVGPHAAQASLPLVHPGAPPVARAAQPPRPPEVSERRPPPAPPRLAEHAAEAPVHRAPPHPEGERKLPPPS